MPNNNNDNSSSSRIKLNISCKFSTNQDGRVLRNTATRRSRSSQRRRGGGEEAKSGCPTISKKRMANVGPYVLFWVRVIRLCYQIIQ